MSSSRLIYLLLIFTFSHQSTSASKWQRRSSAGDVLHLDHNYQTQYTECCEAGQKQALKKGYCTSANFATECKSLSELCCLEQLSLRECQAGVKYVTASRSKADTTTGQTIDCLRLNSFRESYEYRCCSACRMGLLAAEGRGGGGRSGQRKWCTGEWIQQTVGQLVTFSSLVTSHIEASYVQCCNHGLTLLEGAGAMQHDYPAIDQKLARLEEIVPPATNCEDGYEFDEKTQKCNDINECTTAIANECTQSKQYCINTLGGYRCSRCQPGFRFDDHLGVCRDINECEQRPAPCKSGQTCMNVVGSFKCFCQVGYEMDPETGICRDVNECQLGTHNCHESLRCDNTIGSFHCVRVQDCGTGYTINADHDVCEDVNECLLGTHNCAVGYQCRNTQGSFKCDRIHCLAGQEMVEGVCQERRCHGGQVFNESAGRCEAPNYCNSNPCKPTEQCINAAGGFTCLVLCPPGYVYNETVDRCTDLDECITGTFECGANQLCTNLPGHYDCQCKPGFQMDASRSCQDIDECKEQWWLCEHPQACTNTIGSYRCEGCKSGYRLNSSGYCEDIDECSSLHLNHCEHICVNSPGSYRCTCREGYQLGADGRSCTDIDECQLMEEEGASGFKSCSGVCINTDGGFECQCPIGFRKYGEHCVDINECLESRTLCSTSDQSTCINTFGSFECLKITCPSGYRKVTTYKSIQCTWNDTTGTEPATSSFDHIHKLDYLFYSMYSNQSAQFSRTPTYTFYATRFTPEDTSPGSYSSKYGTYFDLRLLSATSTTSISQREYFRLTKRHQHEATVSLLKPIPGPAVVKLELTIIGYKKYSYFRQKVFFTINVSKWGVM